MNAGVSDDRVSAAGRAAHDLGLAAILGGNLFARVGMHPAVAVISDPRERGEVVVSAWRRYGAVNGIGLLAVLGGWAGARASEAAPSGLSERERIVATVKDGAVAALAISGIASAIAGTWFAALVESGAGPLADGDSAAAAARSGERRAKRLLSIVGGVNLAAAATVVVANAALSQASFRRPPVRRLLRRRY